MKIRKKKLVQKGGDLFRKKRTYLILLLICFIFIPLPKPIFKQPYSTILESSSGELLSAKIADDGQWRFPEADSVPHKFATCIRLFEDEYFHYHPGINPLSLLRAAKQNWQAGKIVSGGSTISMQVARMARGNQARTFWQKLIEMWWTLRLEVYYSKEEILQLYAAHAPFGGNVVGLEAAAWRYYKRPAKQLSWAEAATLAVLPNAPALIYPGRNQQALLQKRNRLLEKLAQNEILDSLSLQLAKSEGLPGKPHALPRECIHLLNRALSEGKEGERIQTTIDRDLQQRLNQLVHRNYLQLKQNRIFNQAVLILDNHSNQVLAYVGNTAGEASNHGHRVDVITAQRSTGSLLKPFLYGLAWQDGLILPNSLLADIPTQFGGYAPKNFDKQFDGAVPASKALIRSLNVPAVRLLKNYGLERFYDELQKFPLPSINRGADHYGLSVILGGAEASLWELCTAYKGLSESLRKTPIRNYQYKSDDYAFPSWSQQTSKTEVKQNKKYQNNLQASAIWQLVENLKELNRPGQEQGWENYAGRRTIAWKTGTSFGLRDAWAIGVCPEYTVGVWVGNADGEGRPGLTGISTAAPIMFEAFDLLGSSSWYAPPLDELYQVEVCEQSGYRKGLACVNVDTIFVPRSGKKAPLCSYHQLIQLNQSGSKRVNSNCYPVAKMKQHSYLVLPPLMQWYYRKKEPNYKLLPPWAEGCQVESSQPMDLISPEQADQVLIPVELDGESGRLVVEVAHRKANATIYWHLDDQYIGQSEGIHSKELNPSVEHHTLTLIDQDGNSLSKELEVVE
ncbi:MAG: penicillin-binding protein 1C [Vicingaceae bacterium]